MALMGTAFLCLWNDVDPNLSEEYERWHTQEHVPERVAAPGFLSGRRYGAFERDEGRYLTLYDLDTMDALDTPEYADLQQNPTPWSARMRPHFRNVLRIPFECVALQGKGCAGHVAVFAFETDDRTVGASRQLADAIDRRHDARAIAASHVGRALSVPAYRVFGLPEETGQDRQKIIAIVEITTAEGAAEELQWLQGTLAQNLPVARVLRAETSTLIYKVHHEEVVAQWRRPSAMAVSRERT